MAFKMKKIENWLLWPILFLLFYSISKYGDITTEIYWSDTFYLVTHASLAGWFLAWLVIVLILFKLIRHRQVIIHTKFAFAYIVLTILLFGVFLAAGFVGSRPSNGSIFSDADVDRLMARNLFRTITVYCFLTVQVIFLVYFIVQLRRPAKRIKITGA
jgi:hypothetical protein